MAAGLATAAWLKFSRAKTTPKPEFCIPTSMAMVLATFLFRFSLFSPRPVSFYG